MVEKVDFCGTDAAQVIYRDGAGIVREKVLYRADEDNLKVVEAAMPWSFDAEETSSGSLRRRIGFASPTSSIPLSP